MKALNLPVYEEGLALKAWTYESNNWIPDQENTNNISDNAEFMQEESLPIEPWMLDKTDWLAEQTYTHFFLRLNNVQSTNLS